MVPMIVTRVTPNNVEVKTDHADFYINVTPLSRVPVGIGADSDPGLKAIRRSR